MNIPLEISYRRMEPSRFVEKKLYRRMAQLERLCDEIKRAHAVLSSPHKHKHQGNHYEVHIELHVPGTVLVVTRNTGTSDAHEDFYVAMRDAFDAIERQLTQWKEKRRHDVKAHSRPQAPAKQDREP